MEVQGVALACDDIVGLPGALLEAVVAAANLAGNVCYRNYPPSVLFGGVGVSDSGTGGAQAKSGADGGAGRSRTADPEFRKLLLYPTELQPRIL